MDEVMTKILLEFVAVLDTIYWYFIA